MKHSLPRTGGCFTLRRRREKIPLGALFLVAITEGVAFAFKCLGISDSQLHSLAR